MKPSAVRIQRRKKARRRAENRLMLNDLKNRPCADCGGTFHPACMEFDHRDPTTKVDTVSRIAMSRGTPAILKEIEKCDLVCANCHRMRSVARGLGRNHSVRIRS
ncbi:MAG TPA: hypothetical protein VJU58_03970, partial [Microbacterium sp.]|nr:hypothetical protein [Microbacterium sp.]